MNSNPIPGPWFVGPDKETVYAHDASGDPWTICYAIDPLTGHETREANARLIAAAPDLLTALKTVKLGIESGCVTLSPIMPGLITDLIDEAISKAEGSK